MTVGAGGGGGCTATTAGRGLAGAAEICCSLVTQPLSAPVVSIAVKVANCAASFFVLFFVFNAAPRLRFNRSDSLVITAGIGGALVTMVLFANTPHRNPA
jgi:fluoride ion exporter CrcB/FEX